MLEVIIAIVGVLFGAGGKVVYDRQRRTSAASKIEKELASAQTKASEIVLKAKKGFVVDGEKLVTVKAILANSRIEIDGTRV